MGFDAGKDNTEGVGNTALGCEAMIYAWPVRPSLRAASAVVAEALTIGYGCVGAGASNLTLSH